MKLAKIFTVLGSAAAVLIAVATASFKLGEWVTLH
jgi:hypothetical protein